MSKFITLDTLKTALTKFKANLSPYLAKLDSITGVVTADKLQNPDHPTDLVAYEAFQAAVPLVQSMNLTGAQVGQTIKVKAVNEQGMPTAWEAADVGELKFTKIYEHTVTAEEATTVIEYKITKEAVPNLGKYNIFVGEIEFAEKTALSKWVKLKVNNADVAQICGGVSTDKAVFFSASANRLFGRWCGINVYDTNKNNGTYMITLPCAYSLIANNALDAESVSIHSYAPDFGLVEGAILRVYAAK